MTPLPHIDASFQVIDDYTVRAALKETESFFKAVDDCKQILSESWNDATETAVTQHPNVRYANASHHWAT